MDPFEREFSFRRRMNLESVIAFVIGVVVAYLIQVKAGFGPTNTILTVLIIAAVGGLWYQIRRVV